MNNNEISSLEVAKSAPVEPLMYDIKQAAQVLNCSTKSVRRLIWRGLLKPCSAIRKVLIPRKQIEEFIKTTCGNSNPRY